MTTTTSRWSQLAGKQERLLAVEQAARAKVEAADSATRSGTKAALTRFWWRAPPGWKPTGNSMASGARCGWSWRRWRRRIDE